MVGRLGVGIRHTFLTLRVLLLAMRNLFRKDDTPLTNQYLQRLIGEAGKGASDLLENCRLLKAPESHE